MGNNQTKVIRIPVTDEVMEAFVKLQLAHHGKTSSATNELRNAILVRLGFEPQVVKRGVKPQSTPKD